MRLTERVSKRIDFAKERRAQGRCLNTVVRGLARLIEPAARQHGIDLQARLKEASARRSEERRLLVERLQESVVPLFIGDSDGQPDRIASCVLLRLDSDFFAFTAVHVIRDAASARLFAPSEERGGKLLPLPPCTAHLSSPGRHNDLAVGVLVLPARQLVPFQKGVFLTGTEIDQNDRVDDQGSIQPNSKELSAGAFFTFPEKRSSARLSLLVRKIDAIPGSLWAQESSISWRWSVN
jgi:hypothetical protein